MGGAMGGRNCHLKGLKKKKKEEGKKKEKKIK